jgi:hypothetical protein
VIAFLSECKNDETVVPENYLNLDPLVLGFDLENKIIIYNGEFTTVENKSLAIGTDIFEIETNDSELVIGKKYSINIDKQVFSFFYSELPIISIYTDGVEIVDEPKIKASIVLLESSETHLSAQVGIELRGDVSQTYPKKTYNIEFWKDEEGEDTEKYSLLGMRYDDDWIIDGLWNEPVRIRDFTSHTLWLEFARVQNNNEEMQIGIDKKYCEIFINGEYKGVCYLGERIDRKQLDLKKYTDQLEGELYKAYTWGNGVSFFGVDTFDNNSFTWSAYETKYPTEIEQIDWTNLYNLVSFVVNSSDSDFENEISSKFDIDNIIDYYIFLNLIYATDNNGKNIYTCRYSSSSLYFFVPWDLDGTFGNNWKGLREDITDKMLSNGLYDRLFSFQIFRAQAKERWLELRKNSLNIQNLNQKFRDNYDFLLRNGIYEKEALVPDISQNYSETEIDFIESWIERRIQYLDSYFDAF